jgi:hypothetical protein
MTTAWSQVGSLDESAVAEFARIGGESFASIAQEANALTSGYIGSLLNEGVPASDAYVEPDWRGPFIRSWSALGSGIEFSDAILIGAAQADAIGRNATVSTARQAADAATSEQIVGWYRVLDADPCDWCRMVSTRVYKTAQTADFGHDRCGCGVTPALRSTSDA